MATKRHSDFFKSLHQLEKRLASESRPRKKARIERKIEARPLTSLPNALTDSSSFGTPQSSHVISELTNAKDDGSTKLDVGISLLTVESKSIYPNTICSYQKTPIENKSAVGYATALPETLTECTNGLVVEIPQSSHIRRELKDAEDVVSTRLGVGVSLPTVASKSIYPGTTYSYQKGQIEWSEAGHSTALPDTLTPESSNISSELTDAKDDGCTKLNARISLPTASSKVHCKPIYPDKFCSYQSEVSFSQSNCTDIPSPVPIRKTALSHGIGEEHDIGVPSHVAEDQGLLRDNISVTAKDGGCTKLDAGIHLLAVASKVDSKHIYPDTVCSYQTEISFCQSNCTDIASPESIRNTAPQGIGEECVNGTPLHEGIFNAMHDNLNSNHARMINNDSENDGLLQEDISVSATDLKPIVEFIEESVERIALSEEDGQTYDSMHSNDYEDSCSQLVFSSNWNPWGAPVNTDEFESNPPEEFLPTPSAADDFFESFYSATQDHAAQNDVIEEELHHDELQDLTDLCKLLSLDIDSNRNEQYNMQADDAIPKLPQSDFYSNVAKVQENDSSGYSGALYRWMHSLLESKTDPFSCALFIMAKASLKKDTDTSTGKSIEFPSIVKEWLNDQNWKN